MHGRSGGVAWSLWALVLVISASAAVLIVATGFERAPEAFGGVPGYAGLLGLAFATVGLLLAQRRPENPIGWLFLASSLFMAVQEAATAYGVLGSQRPDLQLPGYVTAVWLLNWIWIPYFVGVMILVFLTFPTGRLRRRRASIIAAAAIVSAATGIASSAFVAGPLDVFPAFENPYALIPEDLGTTWVGVSYAALGLVAVLAAWELFHGWRVAAGVERQQYKWLLAAGALMAVAFAVFATVYVLTGSSEPIERARAGWVSEAAMAAGLVAIPIAVGIAISRYGLYEIDRLISRTLSYALVVGALIGVYAAAAILLGSVLPLHSDLTIAASTLAAAALFHPLRRRVQARVERRFNRSRYDAQRELERLAVRLRDHIDLEELAGDVTDVAERTLQPTSASLWHARVKARQE